MFARSRKLYLSAQVINKTPKGNKVYSRLFYFEYIGSVV